MKYYGWQGNDGQHQWIELETSVRRNNCKSRFKRGLEYALRDRTIKHENLSSGDGVYTSRVQKNVHFLNDNCTV